MSRHTVTLQWLNARKDLDYPTYSRDHRWQFRGGLTVDASAAEEFLGDPTRVDPEAALVASLSSCHMLTFLAIAARRQFVVTAYTDQAEGILEKNDAGKPAMTQVELRPVVSFADGTEIAGAVFEKMHATAHEDCFIANSVKTSVTVLPSIR